MKIRGMAAVLVIVLIAAGGLYLAEMWGMPYRWESDRLDLEDWQGNQVLDLQGEWRFYQNVMPEELDLKSELPGTLVKVPHEWPPNPETGDMPYGVGVYQLEVTGLDPSQIYGIALMDAATAYQLDVNGQEVMTAGSVGKTRQEYRPYWRAQWGAFVSDEDGNALMTMTVSNFDFHRGGFWSSPMLGTAMAIEHLMVGHKISEIFAFASLMSLGMFFFLIYNLENEEKTALHLGIFSWLIAAHALFSGHRSITMILPHLPWQAMVRVEFMIIYLLLPVFGSFVYQLELIQRKSHILRAYLWMAMAVVTGTSILPLKWVTGFLTAYIALAIFFFLFFLYQIWNGLRNRVKESLWVVPGTVVFVGASFRGLFANNHPFFLIYAAYVMAALMMVNVMHRYTLFKQQKERLETTIGIDPLTGTYNRYQLDKLQDTDDDIVSKSQMYWVLFMDLNGFKAINDTYGHNVGDQILQIVARRLENLLRKGDWLFRYGGDEFIAIIPKCCEEKVEHLIHRIRKAVTAPVLLEGKTMMVGISIGSTEFDPSKEPLKDVIKRSDQAMYEEKQQRDKGR